MEAHGNKEVRERGGIHLHEEKSLFCGGCGVVGSTKMDSLPEGIVLIVVFCGSVHEGHQEQRFARQGLSPFSSSESLYKSE